MCLPCSFAQADRHLARHPERAGEPQRADPVEAAAEGHALHELEDEVVRPVLHPPEVARRGDVLVLDVRDDCLALEARDEPWQALGVRWRTLIAMRLRMWTCSPV